MTKARIEMRLIPVEGPPFVIRASSFVILVAGSGLILFGRARALMESQNAKDAQHGRQRVGSGLRLAGGCFWRIRVRKIGDPRLLCETGVGRLLKNLFRGMECRAEGHTQCLRGICSRRHGRTAIVEFTTIGLGRRGLRSRCNRVLIPRSRVPIHVRFGNFSGGSRTVLALGEDFVRQRIGKLGGR